MSARFKRVRMSDMKNSHRLLSEEDDGKVQRRKRKTMQRSKSWQGRPRRVATVILWKPSGLYSAAISQSSSLKSSTSSSSSPSPSRSGFALALWKQVKWLVTRRCWANASGRTTNSVSSNKSVSRRRSCRKPPLEWPGEAAPDPKPAFWSIDREHRWPLQGW